MHDGTRTRRRVLAAAATLVSVSVTGCSSEESGDTSATPHETSSGAVTRTRRSTGTDTATRTATTTPTATPGPVDETFETAEGETLVGTKYGGGSCGVVLVPQVNRDRGSWESQAEWLAESGHLAFAIDEGEDRAAGVAAAVDYLRRDSELESLVLVGASTGGEAVVTAATRRVDDVAGVVTLSAAGGVEYADELPGENLFVVARGDESRFVETARQLHEAAPEPKDLVVYDGTAHGQGLFESPHRENLRDRIGGVLQSACGRVNS